MDSIIRKQLIIIISYALILLIGLFLIWWGFHLANNVGGILISLGTSMISGLVILLCDIWRGFVRENYIFKVNQIIKKAGIIGAWNKRDLSEYDSLINKMSNSLDISGYSLRAFYQSHADVIIEKVKEYNNLEIRILIVDPQSEFSKNRSSQEDSKESFTESINIIRKRFHEFDQIKIKFISVPLSTMIFRIDNTMFVGPHLYKKPSKSTVTIMINKGSWMFNQHQDEFDNMWSSTEAIDAKTTYSEDTSKKKTC